MSNSISNLDTGSRRCIMCDQHSRDNIALQAGYEAAKHRERKLVEALAAGAEYVDIPLPTGKTERIHLWPMTERKIYPVSVLPEKAGEYLCHWTTGEKFSGIAVFYGRTHEPWEDHRGIPYTEDGEPDYWEARPELPEFDERFVAGSSNQ